MANAGYDVMLSVNLILTSRASWSHVASVGYAAWSSVMYGKQSPPKVHITASILNMQIFIDKYYYERTFQVLGINIHHHDCVDCGLPMGSGHTVMQHIELWILLAIIVLLALDGLMLKFFPIAPAVITP